MPNVKSCTNNFGNTTSCIATFASAVAAGNLIWVFVGCTNGGSINTPTDSGSNTYTALDANDNASMFTKAFYAKNIAAGAGNLAVTVTTTAAVFGFVIAHELSGRDLSAPLGASVANFQTSVAATTDAITSTAVTSGDGYDVVGGTINGFSNPTITHGTGFTVGQTPTGDFWGKSESLTQSGAGTKAATFTTDTAGQSFITHVATFKAVAALSLEQYRYRFRKDDGTEVTATPEAAENTPVTMAPDVTKRLRFGINATNDPASEQYKVQYRKQSGPGPWRDIDKNG